MKTKYKWIVFVELLSVRGKTTKWECFNTSNEILGDVYWRNGWRQYIFCPTFDAVEFNNRCLNDIADFLTQLNEIQRK